MKRLVVNASALVSGVASRPGGGPPWLILAALLEFEFEAVACPRLIGEFRDALRNEYFTQRFEPAELDEIAANVEKTAVVHDDPSEVGAILRDTNDDHLVALARESGAEAIVTGDRDLLDHAGLQPPALGAREACRPLGLLD